jgi:hypothetical protein
MYFVLTIAWLVVGVGFILYDNVVGESAWTRGLGFSPGWVMLLLSAYNFMRWWSRRQNRANHDAEYRAYLERRRYRGAIPPVRREPPDPNFNFSDEAYPKPPAETTPEKQPPAGP